MKKTDKKNIGFHKPFAKELLGMESTPSYIYPRDFLKTEPIFPYFILDGGAFNFANDRFGSASSETILSLTMSDCIFDEFTNNDKPGWERSFSFTEGTDFTPKYEWQIWPQRLYMTIPVAHAYLQTHDSKYSEKWLSIVKKWNAEHPYQDFDASRHYLTTDMVWRDMQVAWRSLSLMHSLFMLEDAPFSKEDWSFLYQFVKLHLDHLYREALDRIERKLQQNHVLQIGVALLMGGVLFPEFCDSEEYRKIGCETIKMNLNAIYSDGGSNEDSPSYSHFIVRLYLESYLLLKNNDLHEIEGLEESIRKQYQFLWHCQGPKGKTLLLSDSYSLDTKSDFERIEKLFPLTFSKKEQDILFPESQVAVLHRGNCMLVIDAMDQTNGHRHWGRPQTLLFYGKEPILLDTGCCNYDLWDMYRYCQTAEAHNVVYCPDFEYGKCLLKTGISRFDCEKGEVSTWCEVSDGSQSYRWERKETLTNDTLIIEDFVSSGDVLSWAVNFHLAHHHTKIDSSKSLRQLLDHKEIQFTTDQPAEFSLVPIMNENNRIDYARRVQVSSKGKEFRLKTVFSFRNR